MKFAILGATGATGSLVLQKALCSDHKVKALARNPKAIPPHANLIVVAGDVDNQNAIDSVIEGVDAVICALGVRNNAPGIDVVTKGVKAALVSMKKFGVRRIVVVTSTTINPKAQPDGIIFHCFRWILHNVLLNHLYADHEMAEAVLKQSDLDWTIVQPPMLVPAKPVGYITAVDSHPVGGRGILPFADLAASLLEISPSGFRHQTVVVDTPNALASDEDPAKLYQQFGSVVYEASFHWILVPGARITLIVGAAAALVYIGRRLAPLLN